MRAREWMKLLAVTCWLVWPVLPSSAPVGEPRGGMNWACALYGALAGASLATGNLIGALGSTVAATRAGCFG